VDYLGQRKAHWLLIVKGNQPTLLRQLRALPWTDVPVVDPTSGKGHGPSETRTVKVTAVARHRLPPGPAGPASPAPKPPRRLPTLAHQTVYAITDLTLTQTTAAELADALRTH